mmetsp:Transcript_14740/g.31050  ORF Transcript_14740/g.31050 Transcript_14740/m.31050 type:complete len:405 (+) Transcript_14740:87-1301(+)|eukprot:CAMPEP_0171336018 /NCGR_PEP_ID=MMETSP0878-20121228/5722_1 /TAXON_ID=67004 /ORGANISM="Thalassiosira weissflogii, Strain CCMP1336" /LENGTH=404 /DNA_ID=CAMNT_0011837385 /DNA_START=42 /DNA_END=1256 /DNA_ORIENTATION=-
MIRTCLFTVATLLSAHATEVNFFGEPNGEITPIPYEHHDSEEAHYLRRQLNALIDPKTIESKTIEGYVCAKGKVDWDSRAHMLSELPGFINAWNERTAYFGKQINPGYAGINPGGNGLFHSFSVWLILRSIKPKVVVESGVRDGHMSWLIAKATEDWGPLFVRVDPVARGWDGVTDNKHADKMVDFRGENFVDVADINWDELLPQKKFFFAKKQKKETLFIFDDNQDHLKRILHLHKIGVAHAIFDDNYMPGVGPAFSVKDACDGTGHLRQYFNAYSGTDHELVAPKRCDGHHANCEELPFDDKWWLRYGLAIEVVLLKYWEGPPLAPLVRPYGSIIDYIQDLKKYEGPKTWTEEHSRLVVESTKKPLFPSIEEASIATGIPEEVLEFESGRYIHLAYVNIRVK